MILVNFKIYKKTFGEGAIKLAKICQEVMAETKIPVIPVVSATDVYRITKELGMEVWAQHADPHEAGRWTGKISPLQLQAAGAKGILINHSEDKLPKGSILKLLKILPEGCQSVVCVRSKAQAEFWAKRKVKLMAYEPPELIASQDRSVATEKSEMIRTMAKICGQTPLLAGAGVKSRRDVEVAIAQGAKGILVASAVVESEDPKKPLLELAGGFRNS
ncbi:triose-phosphate isomerase [Patescibacteria group bacterium]|nr:triose-phosphate isomerase [Patescibacteria group bacterium]